MTKIASFIHGVYPRSTELVQVSRDVLRKRRTVTELKKQQQDDFAKLVQLQKSLDFAYVEDGLLTWQDVFRPIVEATDGIESETLTRWFDNNSFFRQPRITGKLRLHEEKLDEFFPKLSPASKWKVTLPSPFTFAKLTDDTTTASFEKTLGEITKLLAQVVKYLDKKGVSYVQFNEPYIPYTGAAKAELALFHKSFTELNRVKGNLTFAIHFYFGDAAPVVKSLAKTQLVDVIGIDFYKTSLSSLPKKLPYDIIAGIVDGRNSLMENKTALKKFVGQAVKHLQPKTLYLSNNSDLELLPESVAREKAALLGEVGNSFKK